VLHCSLSAALHYTVLRAFRRKISCQQATNVHQYL
jgi:hypothetical protein